MTKNSWEVYFLLITGMGQIDHFEDESIFWVCVTDVAVHIQNKAREIDGEFYSPNCFEICVCRDKSTSELSIVTEEDSATGEKCNLYYVDNDGNRHWFYEDLPEQLSKRLFSECERAYAEHERQAMRPSISQRMKEAQAQIEANRDPAVPRRNVPDRGSR